MLLLREPSMKDVITVGIDVDKNVFQVQGVSAQGEVASQT